MFFAAAHSGKFFYLFSGGEQQGVLSSHLRSDSLPEVAGLVCVFFPFRPVRTSGCHHTTLQMIENGIETFPKRLPPLICHDPDSCYRRPAPVQRCCDEDHCLSWPLSASSFAYFKILYIMLRMRLPVDNRIECPSLPIPMPIARRFRGKRSAEASFHQ